MTGLLTRPIVAFTKATSSAVVLRPYCAAIHSYPSACRGTISLLKHEPSAQSPWQNTMLGFACEAVIFLSLILFFLYIRFPDFDYFSGGAPVWLRSRCIHSLTYGEHRRTEMPADSHSFRKRTPSISTKSTSSKSSTAGCSAPSTSDFTWLRCSDRSWPLRRIRVSRAPKIRSIFSVMDLRRLRHTWNVQSFSRSQLPARMVLRFCGNA